MKYKKGEKERNGKKKRTIKSIQTHSLPQISKTVIKKRI